MKRVIEQFLGEFDPPVEDIPGAAQDLMDRLEHDGATHEGWPEFATFAMSVKATYRRGYQKRLMAQRRELERNAKKGQ